MKNFHSDLISLSISACKNIKFINSITKNPRLIFNRNLFVAVAKRITPTWMIEAIDKSMKQLRPPSQSNRWNHEKSVVCACVRMKYTLNWRDSVLNGNNHRSEYQVLDVFLCFRTLNDGSNGDFKCFQRTSVVYF